MIRGKKGQEGFIAFGVGAFLILLIVGMFIGGIYFLHSLAPWWEAKSGEAELARAEQNRQIAVLEAQARLESARLEAQAEVERAKGIAEANEIVGDSLKGNEEYLRYLYIDQLKHTDNQIVYIPTEAGLPILEAGRR
jgi:beta-lactam-binding protein with PASTA domain